MGRKVLPHWAPGKFPGPLVRAQRILPRADEIDTAATWFTRWGKPIVLVGRLFPILRTLISVPAGLAKMPVATFVAFSALGMLIWNTILVMAGYILHQHSEMVWTGLDPLTYVVLRAVGALYLGRLGTWLPSYGL